ncbi:unannotated protein [freshwater metagenome]|uniref:Unannotated protein n=1 Tax=freshwater metagenome TaxID=449393 RepID=A0A6J6P4R2_9ZZZZ
MTEPKPRIKIEKYGIKQSEDGYQLDFKSLLASVGGFQGLIESTLPGFLYVLTFAIWRSLTISISTVVAAVLLLTIRHFVKKRPFSQLVGSLIGIALAIYLTLRPGGQAGDFYLKDFWTNGIYGSVLLLSVVIRLPIIGVMVGLFTNQGLTWRKNRRKVRFFDLVTLLWVGLFATRLAVELPLYFVGDIVTLGFVKLVLGLPFYLTMIWVSWLLLRKVITPAQDGILDK